MKNGFKRCVSLLHLDPLMVAMAGEYERQLRADLGLVSERPWQTPGLEDEGWGDRLLDSGVVVLARHEELLDLRLRRCAVHNVSQPS